MASISVALGRWQYLKAKSTFYIETVRSWVTPAAAAGAFAKYIGFSSKWSVMIALVVPIVVEVGGFLLGRFLWEHGGVEKEYTMALEKDPYKVKQIEYQDAALERLGAIQRANEEAIRMFREILPAGQNADGR